MNLRDLQNFVISQMTNRLTECGINVDQIEQIKIRDRQIPSNDNDDNVVWMLDTVDIDKNPIWMIYKYGGHPNRKKTKNITTRFLMSIKPLFVNNITIIGLTRK